MGVPPNHPFSSVFFPFSTIHSWVSPFMETPHMLMIYLQLFLSATTPVWSAESCRPTWRFSRGRWLRLLPRPPWEKSHLATCRDETGNPGWTLFSNKKPYHNFGVGKLPSFKTGGFSGSNCSSVRGKVMQSNRKNMLATVSQFVYETGRIRGQKPANTPMLGSVLTRALDHVREHLSHTHDTDHPNCTTLRIHGCWSLAWVISEHVDHGTWNRCIKTIDTKQTSSTSPSPPSPSPSSSPSSSSSSSSSES